jgi:hypothetical protein
VPRTWICPSFVEARALSPRSTKWLKGKTMKWQMDRTDSSMLFAFPELPLQMVCNPSKLSPANVLTL